MDSIGVHVNERGRQLVGQSWACVGVDVPRNHVRRRMVPDDVFREQEKA